MTTPEQARIRDRMLEHLGALLGPGAGPPDPGKDLRKHYALDSLALVSLFFQAMEAFRIDPTAIAPERFATLRSLDDIIELGRNEAEAKKGNICIDSTSQKERDMSDLFRFVVGVLEETCQIDGAKVTLATNLVEELSIDSVDFLDVVYEIDKKYQVNLPVEDWLAAIGGGEATTSDFFVMENFLQKIEAEIGRNAATTAKASA